MEKVAKRVFVDWNKKRVIRGGLAGGTYYATYYDRDAKNFAHWRKRKEINKIKNDLNY